MRLFIAIELPGIVVAHLGKMQDVLRSMIEGRWTPPEQLHVTLKFLGETANERVSDLLRAVRAVEIEEEISLGVNGLACFPPRGPVRIVAAGLEDVDGACARLQERIDLACKEAGFALDGRKWTAHVTLARLKDGAGAGLRQQAAEAVAGLLPGPGFFVQRFAVIESRLERRGAVYVRVG